MKRPYNVLFLISVALVVFYFLTENKPTYIDPVQDRKDMLVYGAIYVVLIFGTLSLMYLYFRQNKRKRRW